MSIQNPERHPENCCDRAAVETLLEQGQTVEAWQMLPSVVRREILYAAPFGTRWSSRVPELLDRLTEEGAISIISPIVTRDSDEPTL